MRYSFLVITLSLFISTQADAQNIFDDMTKNKDIIAGLGASCSEFTTGEISAMLSHQMYVGPCVPGYGYMGPRISTEFSFAKGGGFIAPKISYEANFIILGGRLGIADYTNFRTHEICFVPEAGFTYFGFIDLYFGYNIPLTTARLSKMQSAKFTVTLNWDATKRLF